MKLGDLLLITNEHTNVKIVQCDTNDVISEYDGKNSIDATLNDKSVVMQFISSNELYVVIVM